MLKIPGRIMSETILPIIPPPMPASSVSDRSVPDRSVPASSVPVPRAPSKAKGLPTKIWKDTRGFYRKPNANANANANASANANK